MKKFFLVAAMAMFLVGCSKSETVSIGEGETEVEVVDFDTLPEMDSTTAGDSIVFTAKTPQADTILVK